MAVVVVITEPEPNPAQPDPPMLFRSESKAWTCIRSPCTIARKALTSSVMRKFSIVSATSVRRERASTAFETLEMLRWMATSALSSVVLLSSGETLDACAVEA